MSSKPNKTGKAKPAKPHTPAVEEANPEVETRGRGRPTKINSKVMDEILKNIRGGIPIRTAAQMTGIDESTYFKWMKRGSDESYRINKGEKPNPEEADFFHFFQSAMRAREEAKGAHVAVISNAGARGDWRASAWWLSRQFRDEFGDNPTPQVQNITNNTLNISTSMAELQTLIAEIKERRTKVIDAPSD